MVKIGSAEIETNVFLAPLSGCSDLAFRLICREHGAKFCFFEMVDSNSVVYGPRHKTEAILKTVPEDVPIAAQVLGEDALRLVTAAKAILERTQVSFIDINAACPARKVVKKRAGSYLLCDSANLYKIVKKLAASLPVPVTVKLRLAFDTLDIKTITGIAKKCESNGAAALFVHGRTTKQGYTGDVDYKSIKAIKNSVKIPVFGSGNVFTPQLAGRMFSETGCDGVLVARGALGNPWIFDQLSSEIPLLDRKKTLKRHLAYIEKYNSCRQSAKIGSMRKVSLWYLKGFPNAARIRHEISVVNNYEKMIKLIDSISEE